MKQTILAAYSKAPYALPSKISTNFTIFLLFARIGFLSDPGNRLGKKVLTAIVSEFFYRPCLQRIIIINTNQTFPAAANYSN